MARGPQAPLPLRTRWRVRVYGSYTCVSLNSRRECNKEEDREMVCFDACFSGTFGARVQGNRVWGLGFGVQDLGFRVSGFGMEKKKRDGEVLGLGFSVSGFGFSVSGLGFRV